jgi:hypothetical protein
MKSGFLAAVAACSLLLPAPASAQGVKIGVLNDQSGVYADYGGKYSVEAAKMATEDFGGDVLGRRAKLAVFTVKKLVSSWLRTLCKSVPFSASLPSRIVTVAVKPDTSGTPGGTLSIAIRTGTRCARRTQA